MKNFKEVLIERICRLPGAADEETYQSMEAVDLLDDYEELLRLMWDEEQNSN